VIDAWLFQVPQQSRPRYCPRLVASLVEAESTRAPVGVQAVVVLCCGWVAGQGGMNDDQFHVLTTVDVGGQHAVQLRIFGWSHVSGAV
jgi:hypothetical protein